MYRKSLIGFYLCFYLNKKTVIFINWEKKGEKNKLAKKKGNFLNIGNYF